MVCLCHKFLWLLVLCGLFTSGCSTPVPSGYVPREGDIIFQTSTSWQSEAIQLATGSPYSHMGLVFFLEDQPMVFEAVQPVKYTPLADWIDRGKDSRFLVKRLRDADRRLSPEILQAMRREGMTMLNRDYDPYFAWTDDTIYCSELVWKIYERGAGIRLGEPQRLREFDLSHPVVQSKMNARYNGAPPLEEIVISPGAIFASAELETVYGN